MIGGSPGWTLESALPAWRQRNGIIEAKRVTDAHGAAFYTTKDEGQWGAVDWSDTLTRYRNRSKPEVVMSLLPSDGTGLTREKRVAANTLPEKRPLLPSERTGARAETEVLSESAGPQQTRTSASVSHSCRWCGEEVRGRRRNGFCSDRCQMRAKRKEKQATASPSSAPWIWRVLRRTWDRVSDALRRGGRPGASKD